MDTLENCGKTLTSHKEKIGKALQTVRGLMDDLDHVNNFRSELEAEIVSETNKDSVVRRNAMLQAISLPARAETLSDLALALAILIQLERQFLGLDYASSLVTDEDKSDLLN